MGRSATMQGSVTGPEAPAVVIYNAVWLATHDAARKLGCNKRAAKAIAVKAAMAVESAFRLETE